ncbi:MAG: hypothetical protein CVV61_03400 [Tenericutes bacterium HGW-Tenericutes-6]|jgi:hypothetical protein|nr:MAG: hypothetical protein CVV61_03400 [Tenericutes bacterium HGW-Tenericutes-6]
MKKDKNTIIMTIGIVGSIVFLLATLMLLFGDELDQMFNVIGIRVATLFVAFASFLSSMLFSLLILLHNRTVVKINDDTNHRAELFRELQFASGNYSIIEFMDRMLIYEESSRYVDRLIQRKSMIFHMIEEGLVSDHIFKNPNDYQFVSLKIPFRVIEGKTISSITFDKLRFERNGQNFEFFTPESEHESRAFLLYNEVTKRNNVIINLIMRRDSVFYDPKKINVFSKIKIYINITSLLGVKVKGNSELYFTNPEQIEGDGTNTYRINSANFTLTEMPKIVKIQG